MRRTTAALAALAGISFATPNVAAPASKGDAEQAEKAKECEYLKGRIASTHSLIASQEKQKLQAEASVRECEDGLKTKKYVSCEGVRAIPKGIQESIEKSKKNLREAETAQKRLCF